LIGCDDGEGALSRCWGYKARFPVWVNRQYPGMSAATAAFLRGGQFRPPGRALAGRGVGMDVRTAGAFQRLDLAGQVLLLGADAGVADAAFRGLLFETHLRRS
jgi:hypothetical protein